MRRDGPQINLYRHLLGGRGEAMRRGYPTRVLSPWFILMTSSRCAATFIVVEVGGPSWCSAQLGTEVLACAEASPAGQR
jgi:hypothetical protein